MENIAGGAGDDFRKQDQNFNAGQNEFEIIVGHKSRNHETNLDIIYLSNLEGKVNQRYLMHWNLKYLILKNNKEHT